MKYLIIGQGRIGQPVAIALARLGHQVLTLARTPKIYQQAGMAFWQKDALTLTRGQLQDIDRLAIIVTPSKHPDRVQAYQDSYLAVCQHIARLKPSLAQILFVSSTSVYGQNAGEVIDENSQALPSTDSAKILLCAENSLRESFGERCVIVRPSGIYGKSYRHLIDRIKSDNLRLPSQHLSNCIMQADLIQVLTNILTMDNAKALYLVSDFAPSFSSEVMAFICQKLNLPAPDIYPSSPTGKKILPNIPVQWLNFPDYQSGWSYLLDKNRS